MTTGGQTDVDLKKMRSSQLHLGFKKATTASMTLSDVLQYYLVTASALRRSTRKMNLLASHAKMTKQNQNTLNLLPSFINGVQLAVAGGERARQTPGWRDNATKGEE